MSRSRDLANLAGDATGLETITVSDITDLTATAAELNKLDGVTASTAELNKLDGVTADTAELNKLDGVTASTTELNKLDGVTADTAEINKLDGVTADTAELNKLDGVTASTAELNYVDGVTSAVQTQINGLGSKTVPHIIPGVLYPAVGGNDIHGADIDTSHGSTYTYGTAHTDGRKYYYTDIKGSKPIKDPRIGGHFGSQRHQLDSLQLLEQETATNGGNVYSVDGREWIRVVGGITTTNDLNGLRILLNSQTDFVEIVGYFSDLNYGVYTDGANRTLKYSLDGGGESSDYGATTASTPLGSRFVDTSSSINLGLGATLGIHTIKLRRTGTSINNLYNIELIAQDTTSTANKSKIQIPSQDVVSYGKKFNVSGTPHYDPFNGFTSGSSVSSYIDTDTSLGVEKWKNSSTYYRPYNGGRVVKWVDSSGVIKTSVTLMPPNAKSTGDSSSLTNGTAKANASIANNTFYPTFEAHTTDVNEDQLHEVAKTFHWREFGNGGANAGTGGASYADASMLSSDDNIAYVMDDGLTSLSAYDVAKSGSYQVMKLANANRYFYLTFIGTGISFRSIETTDAKVYVAQNLPYGTHILKVTRGGTHTVTIDGVDVQTGTLYSFEGCDIYQPKRPPIPEDACVIADYMLMADFVAVTSLSDGKIHKGVRRNAGSRDHFYDVSGGSFDSNVTLNLTYAREFGLWANQSPASSHTASTSLPFFGTRISNIFENQQESHTLTIDGGSDLSGSCTKLDNSTINTLDAWVSPVQTLGLHNFTHTRITGGRIYNGTDIATPIHTSHHYQSFETPFLHELVGGDRNMEQTNLVVSPDGKTWDQLTRDASYIGKLSVMTRTSSAQNHSSNTLVNDEHRGIVNSSVRAYGNKYFAIAYDRFICLRDGFYTINRVMRNGGYSAGIKVNGELIAEGDCADEDTTQIFATVLLKRGDYVQFTGGNSANPAYNFSHISRAD